MTEDNMGEFIQSLKSERYRPQSNSSTMLFEKLSTDEQLSNDIEDKNNKKREKRLEVFLTKHNYSRREAENLFDQEALEKIRENTEYDAYYWPAVKQSKVGFDQSKADLYAYFNDGKNNGKKLFQLVVGFFGRKCSVQVDDVVSENTKLLINNSIG